MAIERKWESIPPQTILSDGSSDGLLPVPDPGLFKVKQIVKLFSNSRSPTIYEVKRVTPDGLYLGDKGKPIYEYKDVSMWTVSDSTQVSADEQERPSIVPDAYNRASYEEEPVVGHRVVLVDKLGRKYDLNNPLPTNATFTGSLTVNLDGDGVNGDTVGIKGVGGDRVVINPDGSMTVKDPTLATILSSVFNLLNSGTINVDDANTQASLASVISALTDIYTYLGSGTQIVTDATTHTKLDTIISSLGSISTILTDTLWTKLSKSVDRSRVSGYSDVVVSGRTLKRLDYVEYSAPSVSVSQKIRVSYTWLDFGTKDERVGPIVRSVLSI